MIDIHAHIIPGVDDGPETIEEAVRMLEDAAEQGITHIYATSHAKSPQYDVSVEQIKSGVALLREAVEANDIKINILHGQEIRIHPKLLEDLVEGKALPLGDSQYVLVEFPTREIPDYAETVFEKMLSNNYVPIIAHPEKNRPLMDKPELLYKFVKQGCLSQVTTGSLAGHFGSKIKDTALSFIRHQLVHCIGSDVHNLTSRPLLYNEGINELDKKGLSKQADILIENNFRIQEGKLVIVQEPMKPAKKWWNVFQRA